LADRRPSSMSVFGQLQTVKLASGNDCSSAEAAVSRSLRYQDRLSVRFPLDEGSLPTYSVEKRSF
jgi:hypothetical protein